MVAAANPRRQLLEAAQARAALRRAQALVDYAPTLCGLRLRPVSLDSHNALLAFENGFVTGAGITLVDVVNFVWLHHPEFGQFNRAAKRRVTLAVARWHYRGFHRTNDFLRSCACFPGLRWLSHRWVTRSTVATRITETITEIRRLLTEALVDFPKGDDEGEPLPFSHPVYILNTLRRRLDIPHAETRALPLKFVAQILRECVHHASDGKALLLTAEEAAIWADDLAAKTEAAQAAAAAARK